MGLKLLAYGVSVSAFVDYFQTGVSTGRLCFHKLCKCISESEVLCSNFMRVMNRADAHRATDLHLQQHGVDGMLKLLDCVHVGWKNCPVAWQGAFQGKEKAPTIVLEAVADYNLWIMHAAFGFAGSLNDNNMWEQSPLLKLFVDGTFAKDIDFEFEIAGKVFHCCWFLVDGIYPGLARFAKTIDEPLGHGKKLYAVWQEASGKDVERAFGVLRKKFFNIKEGC
jgi:Plant transposon protein